MPDGPLAVARAALDQNPAIDTLVCNAGTYIDQPFIDMDFATFDKTMKLNVYSQYVLVQFFARRWISQGVAGRVLLIGSINGRLSEPTHVAYDTSKGAVEAMVRSLCVSLAPFRIRVNGLAPGLLLALVTRLPHPPRGVAVRAATHAAAAGARAPPRGRAAQPFISTASGREAAPHGRPRHVVTRVSGALAPELLAGHLPRGLRILSLRA
jgi:NAD(P)-dependent dehydrogenase (short-subunit alcohol dehydrogenase family)